MHYSSDSKENEANVFFFFFLDNNKIGYSAATIHFEGKKGESDERKPITKTLYLSLITLERQATSTLLLRKIIISFSLQNDYFFASLYQG